MANSMSSFFRGFFLLDEPGTGTLHLVRHGEPVHHRRGGDSADPGLSRRGARQSRRLGRRLPDRTIQAVYTSPLRRTVQTSEQVVSELNRTVEVLEGLRAMEWGGSGDGKGSAGATARPSDPPEGFENGFHWSDLGSTRAGRTLRERSRETIDTIVTRHPGENVLVVTHTGVINAYLSECLGVAYDVWFLPSYTGLTTIKTAGSRRLLVRLNDCAHL